MWFGCLGFDISVLADSKAVARILWNLAAQQLNR